MTDTRVNVPSVTVPYRPGHNHGIGVDLLTGDPRAKVANGRAEAVAEAPGAEITFNIRRIQTTAAMERALGIGADASYGSAAFGAGVSGRFQFVKDAKVRTSSLILAVTAEIELAHLSIDAPTLSRAASNLVQSRDEFEVRFGNAFVRGLGRGGLFVGTIRLDSASREHALSIAAELEGTYVLFSGDAETKFSALQERYQSELAVEMYRDGGPVHLPYEDVGNPLQLLANANAFLKSFEDEPNKVARPYSATLAPVAIAQGPLPDAGIQKALAVLRKCAQERSQNIDELNMLEYMASNPSKFGGASGNAMEAVRKALKDVRADLELLEACAQSAIDNPSSAIHPAEFARRQRPRSRYPRYDPDTLPPPANDDAVAVPDFSGSSDWEQCVALGAEEGLTVTRKEMGDPGDTFKVIGQEPDAGTSVPEQAVVKVYTRPVRAKIDFWDFLSHPNYFLRSLPAGEE